MEKIAASVVLKMFINDNGRRHTTVARSASVELYFKMPFPFPWICRVQNVLGLLDDLMVQSASFCEPGSLVAPYCCDMQETSARPRGQGKGCLTAGLTHLFFSIYQHSCEISYVYTNRSIKYY